MITKAIEIRDVATFIPAIAIKMWASNDAERYLLRRCGYSDDGRSIILTRMNGDGRACSDPYDWCDRTFTVVHNWLLEHFEEVVSGDVVDVAFLLGETTTPKVSERIEGY